jgi:hypothetical protein
MVTQKTVHGIDALKRKDASVIKHGQGPAVPNEQWEMNINATPAGADRPSCDNWLPRAGKDRPTPHKKINECDH